MASSKRVKPLHSPTTKIRVGHIVVTAPHEYLAAEIDALKESDNAFIKNPSDENREKVLRARVDFYLEWAARHPNESDPDAVESLKDRYS